MGSGWRRARSVLGLNACAGGPDSSGESPLEEEQPSNDTTEVGTSEVVTSITAVSAPATPSRSPSRLNLIRTSIRLSRSTCAICLENMKPGLGQALFTAECSHTFHFSCIASNVRHGNLVCPVCRAKWKEVPWQAPIEISKEQSRPAGYRTTRRSQTTPIARQSPQQSPLRSPLREDGGEEISMEEEEEQRRLDPVLRILDESIANARGIRRTGPQEPSVFDDDEALRGVIGRPERERGAGDANTGAQEAGEGPSHAGISEDGFSDSDRRNDAVRKGHVVVDVACYPEVEAIAGSEGRESFTVLVHLKSLTTRSMFRQQDRGAQQSIKAEPGSNFTAAQLLDASCRAPLDLICVLDISGSMSGTKLVLLKRAMGFVVRNLSPADRLSVVAFSSSARRLFPLRLMVDDGRQLALRCIDSLVSTGGTNIADGLRKGAKVLEDRRMRNPVASIMLLSDGQDTYTMSAQSQLTGFSRSRIHSTDYRRLLPGSIRHGNRYGHIHIPVHTFGFGADHDAATMHSISEISGGTFSFIQTESVVQDAFAQCIGGLLSVVVQDAQLNVSFGAPGIQIRSVISGSYESSIRESGSHCVVKLGDLYAEEERDILVDLKLPPLSSTTPLLDNVTPTSRVLKVECCFRDPVSAGIWRTPYHELHILRPEFVDKDLQALNLEVDRQKNRVRIAQTILEAGTLADAGDITGAQQVLQNAKDALQRSASAQAGDALCSALQAELEEIQARMANRQMYERSGRAFVLSAQSSHFHQRATTRGDFVHNHSREYQTPSMVDMILRSQMLAPPRETSASASTTPTRERRGYHNRPAMSPSPTRMLMRRSSGKVQDSHGRESPAS